MLAVDERGIVEVNIHRDTERAAGKVDKFLLMDGSLYAEAGIVTDNPIPSIGEEVEIYEIIKYYTFVNKDREPKRRYKGTYKVKNRGNSFILVQKPGQVKCESISINDILYGHVEIA